MSFINTCKPYVAIRYFEQCYDRFVSLHNKPIKRIRKIIIQINLQKFISNLFFITQNFLIQNELKYCLF